MDVVIGIAMTTHDARILLVEGSRGDGAVIDHDSFDADTRVGVEQPGFSEHVVSAVLGTYAAASANGNTVVRVALTWTDAVAIEADLVIEALDQLGITNVAVISASDAVDAAAHHMAADGSVALCVIEPDTTMLAVLGAEIDGTRPQRSRRLDAPDVATTVLALRGMCDSFSEPVTSVVIGGSADDVDRVVDKLSSDSRPVKRSDEAALLLGRGALLASADSTRGESADTSASVFVPRAARLSAAPELAETDEDDASAHKGDPVVRTLSAVVAAAVLTLAVSLFFAMTNDGAQGDSEVQVSAPANHADPLPPSPVPVEPPPVLAPDAAQAAMPAMAAPPPQPPPPLIAAALSDPRINAVAQKVVPPAVHAAQTPITVPHTDITLPPLTQVIGR
ncbi:DUF7159 family protein [Mycolicibacterium mageritense]|uniref:DUF7159 domain-containing protein n=3 Tax=Mycolicibacterium mageritense TaxID=53462 RepID=A0AAI8TV82_MYCME|nr:hypothetical protein hbim_03104 [Mycolicibacterium mageritense]